MYKRYITASKQKKSKPTFQDEPNETHGSYGALLFDKRWRVRRQQILEKDNHKCVVCKTSEDLQVHHRQYHFYKILNKFKPPWDYKDNLLITLCNKCHSKGHSKYKVPTIYI